MAVDRTEEERWREKQKRYRASNESDDETPLKGGGGDGTSGGMEARIARLEADMAHVKSDVTKLDASVSDVKKSLATIQVDVAKGVGEIKAGIATITAQMKHVPSRWDVFLMFAAFLTATAAIVALAVRFIPGAA